MAVNTASGVTDAFLGLAEGRLGGQIGPGDLSEMGFSVNHTRPVCNVAHIGERPPQCFFAGRSRIAVELISESFGLPEEQFAPSSAPPAEAIPFLKT